MGWEGSGSESLNNFPRKFYNEFADNFSFRCLTLLLPALGNLFSFAQKLLYVSLCLNPSNNSLSNNSLPEQRFEWKLLFSTKNSLEESGSFLTWKSDTLSLEEFFQYMYSNEMFQKITVKKQSLENCSLNEEYSFCRKNKWYNFVMSKCGVHPRQFHG